MSRLIVKNFGPLKDVDIELNRINLFIGENGSGKSVLAKLITVIFDLSSTDEKKIFKSFNEYNISYITNNSIIEYYEDKLLFSLKEKKIFFSKERKEVTSELKNLEKEKKSLYSAIKNLKNIMPYEELEKKILENEIVEEYGSQYILNILKEVKEDSKYSHEFISQYIPAERNLISLFNKSLTTLLVAEVPLPKFLLQFSSDFEKAGNELKELEFLNIKYVNGDGLDRHKVYFNDKDYLPLEFSSSGIQSALPLYLTVKYFANRHHSIIIEEPEQNLFPKAQAETIKYIIEQVSNDNSLFMMTHSPYVLSTLNNLIMAYKVAQMSTETKEQVKELIKEEQWINPSEFSAYYLEDGIAKNIVSKRGLISDNKIDDISEEITGEFDDLMQIYREFKYAK